MAEETKVIGQMPWQTVRIINMIRDKPEGSIVTYDEITRAVGCPKQDWDYWARAARKHVLKQSGYTALWKPQNGDRFIRLNSSEKIESVGQDIQTTFRKVRKSVVISENIDYTNLTNEQKNKAILLGTVAKAANSILSPKSIKQAEQQKLYTPQEYIKRLTGG